MGMWYLAAILRLLCVQDGADAHVPGSTSPPLERIAVIGASASAGFGLRDDEGGRLGLARVIDIMLKRAPGSTSDYASDLFFLSADQWAKSSLERATEPGEPSLVVALDFLFWFGYGSVRHEPDRLKNMERGLQYLDRFKCPVLIATLPDMSSAVGKMLSEQQVPHADLLDELNRAILRWANRHRNVALVPLPRLVAEVRAGLPVRVRTAQLPKGYPVLQADQLHPTMEGLALLAILAMDALSQKGWDLPPDHIIWDPIALGRAVHRSARFAAK